MSSRAPVKDEIEIKLADVLEAHAQPSAPAQPQNPDPVVTLSQVHHLLNIAVQQAGSQTEQQIAAAVAQGSAPRNISYNQAPAKVHLNKPVTFRGAVDENAETWLATMLRYLDAGRMTVEVERVAMAATYLEKDASTWWNSIEGNSSIHTMKEFQEALYERFSPLALAQVARAKLKALCQGNMSASEYVNRFQQIASMAADIKDPEKLDTFLTGLRPILAERVAMQEPETTQAAMSLAIKLELLLQNVRLRQRQNPFNPRSGYGMPFSSYPRISRVGGNNYYNGTAAMELGNMNYEANEDYNSTIAGDDEYERYMAEGDDYEPSYYPNNPTNEDHHENEIPELHYMQQRRGQERAPFLPPEEFKRCMEYGLCLRCKQAGHIHRNCPNVNRNRSPMATNTGTGNRTGAANITPAQAGPLRRPPFPSRPMSLPSSTTPGSSQNFQ